MRFPLLILFALFVCGVRAQAHPNLQNAMWVQFEPSRVHVAVNVSLKEIAIAQGEAPGGSTIADSSALQRAAERHGDYVLKHFRVSAGTHTLEGRVAKLTLPASLAAPEQTYYQYELEYPLGGPPPGGVTFYQDMLREWPYTTGAAWDVSYVVRAKRADSSEVSSWLLRRQQALTIPTGWERPAPQADTPAEANGWRAFRDYFSHGVMHILTGYDHLLFVSALVIATMSFWEMVKVIAAFTLAHTLTLALCVFGVFRLPASIVEPVIALSIVFVAVENVLRPKRAHSSFRLAVAFGFGLIHGLGFAGGLLDAMVGLPSIGIWIALAAFSIGVEVGHQVVVLPFFGLMSLSRRRLPHGFSASASRYGSTAISCCGAYYLVVALHGQFFSR